MRKKQGSALWLIPVVGRQFRVIVKIIKNQCEEVVFIGIIESCAGNESEWYCRVGQGASATLTHQHPARICQAIGA